MGFTRYQGFDPSPNVRLKMRSVWHSTAALALFCHPRNSPTLTPMDLVRWFALWIQNSDVPCLPSGNLSHSYGKIHPFLMGKSTISVVIFNRYFDITRGYVQLSGHLKSSQVQETRWINGSDENGSNCTRIGSYMGTGQMSCHCHEKKCPISGC